MAINNFILKIGTIHCESYPNLKDARDAHNSMREKSGEGASTWPRSTISNGAVKMRISYNGRVWDKNGVEIIVS